MRDSLTPSAAVGSSMMTTLRAKAALRATATPWRWPPESVPTRLVHGANTDLEIGHVAHGVAHHALFVQHAKHAAQDPRPADLAAEKDILHDVELGRHGQILVDRLDAMAARVQRPVEVHAFAVERGFRPRPESARRQAP